jgi:hypothetical protein
MTPQNTYKIVCEKLREVKFWERELIISELKQDSGWLAKFKLFLDKNLFKVCLLIFFLVFSPWLIVGLLLKAERADNLAIQVYLIIGLLLTVVVSVCNGFLAKLTPKSEMEYSVRFLLVAQRYQFQTYLRASEAKEKLEEAIDDYQEKWKFLYYILWVCTGLLINSLSSPKFFNAIFLLSPSKIYQANEGGAWALLILLIGGYIYLKECTLPCAWMRNTAKQIRITNRN